VVVGGRNNWLCWVTLQGMRVGREVRKVEAGEEGGRGGEEGGGRGGK